ncbi:MAG TPA: hypothetical protein ENN07_00655 [candidate division Zixibacteria bacterium]|nr:hypothetical protein [candidate division Zixibacteria bacterium]
MLKRIGILVIFTGLFLASCENRYAGPGVGPECTLAWVSYLDGAPNIFYIDLPDGDIQKLTDNPEGAGKWGISHYGDWVYFGGRHSERMQIFRICKDGTGLQRLTDEWEFDGNPEVSPCGEKICFVTQRWFFTYRDRELALMPSDGGDVQRLTTHEGNDDSHKWSPDGTAIAFVRSGLYGSLSVAVINPDNPSFASIVSPEGHDAYCPQWSPCGQFIYYVLSGGDRRYIAKSSADAIGEFPENISGGDFSVENIAVSPDGTKIAFQAYIDGRWDIAVIASNGGNLRFIASHPAEDITPCWSPDGSWIFWVSMRDGNREIYGAPLDTGDPVRITNFAGDDIRPICWPKR